MGEKEKDSVAFLGFQNMMRFIGRCQENNVRIVVGSHGPWNKYIEMGWTYQHEMWLFAQAGMKPMNIIKAATIENAKFFKIDHRLGSIEKGKQAHAQINKVEKQEEAPEVTPEPAPEENNTEKASTEAESESEAEAEAPAAKSV